MLHYARALALNAQLPEVSNCVWVWARPVGLQPLSVTLCIWNPWVQNPAPQISQLFILRWSAVPSGRSKPNRADNIMTAARLHAATLRSILRNQMFLQLLGT